MVRESVGVDIIDKVIHSILTRNVEVLQDNLFLICKHLVLNSSIDDEYYKIEAYSLSEDELLVENLECSYN